MLKGLCNCHLSGLKTIAWDHKFDYKEMKVMLPIELIAKGINRLNHIKTSTIVVNY